MIVDDSETYRASIRIILEKMNLNVIENGLDLTIKIRELYDKIL